MKTLQRNIRTSICLLLLSFAGISALAFIAPETPAQQSQVIDGRRFDKRKAHYLYSFGRYVNWPKTSFEETGNDFVIGVFGKNVFGDELFRIASERKVQGRTIKVYFFNRPEEYRPCQVLYFPASTPREQQMAMLLTLKDKPVLTVGEIPDFTQIGGVVRLYLDDDSSIHLEVNIDAAADNHLAISAKLISVTQIVRADDRKHSNPPDLLQFYRSENQEPQEKSSLDATPSRLKQKRLSK